MRRIAYQLGTSTLIGIASLSIMACVDTSAPPSPAISEEELPNMLVATPDALVMAVNDTVPATVAAINIFGDPLSLEGGAPVVWESSDVGVVEVDSTGTIVAKAPTASDAFVSVIARWTHNGVTQGDTVIVNVTPTRIPAAGIRIVADSTRTSSPSNFILEGTSVNVITVNAIGDSIAAPRIPLFTADNLNSSSVIAVYLGQLASLFGRRPYFLLSNITGDYWIHASSTVYGVPMRDSLKMTGLYPSETSITITRDSVSSTLISPQHQQEMLVQPCASIKFQNNSPVAIDITFDDLAKIGQCLAWDEVGDIVDLQPGLTATRKVPTLTTLTWTARAASGGSSTPALTGKVTTRTP